MAVRNVETKYEDGRSVVVREWTEFEGCVLDTYSRDVRVMSDVWEMCRFARVWDAEAGTVREVHAGHGATVDATEETLAAVTAWENAKAEAATMGNFEKARAEARKDAEDPFVKGRRVRVERRRGRGAPPKGTEGTVFWTGHSSGYGTPRLGLKDDAGETHWTAASNCDVVDPDYGCETCCGCGWEPARDGKGGRKRCASCAATEYAASAGERAALTNRLNDLAVELTEAGYHAAARLVVEATNEVNAKPESEAA